MESCIHTNGEGLCRKCRLLQSFEDRRPQSVKLHFTGPSPPEVFVGRTGYPHVQAGILAPPTFETKHHAFNSAQQWSHANLSVANVLRLRSQLIYGKSIVNIKSDKRIQETMKELALTHARVSTEFFLKRKPTVQQLQMSHTLQPMTNPAPLQKVIIEDNTKVHKKVDAAVNDTDARAVEVIGELQGQVTTDHLQKLLSVGLLGKRKTRKMVPTRWSITAIDDTVSKQLLDRIRTYKEISEITLYQGSYLGNYIYMLLLPGMFSFEAMEVWSEDEQRTTCAQDYEDFNPRKTYATNVTGGYYAMRLPAAELLDTLKRQATVLVFREITDEYYASLGVGIVREATRRAINQIPQTYASVSEAVQDIKQQQRLNHNHLEKSWILKNYGKQQRLQQFL